MAQAAKGLPPADQVALRLLEGGKRLDAASRFQVFRPRRGRMPRHEVRESAGTPRRAIDRRDGIVHHVLTVQCRNCLADHPGEIQFFLRCPVSPRRLGLGPCARQFFLHEETALLPEFRDNGANADAIVPGRCSGESLLLGQPRRDLR